MKNKRKFIKDVSKLISTINEVLSINFVGSFLNSNNYSDVDIIIITKKIDSIILKKCCSLVKSIKIQKYGIDKKVLINNTFGPLKFNTKKNFVIHLMIYSLNDHIEHVNNSPFTCYDWERFDPSFGKKLKEIYPVNKILISDFLSKNRGITEYKKSLEKRSINYKKYQLQRNILTTKKLQYKLKGKDIHEFCYHIITFLSKNLLKLLTNKNINFNKKEIFSLLNKISIKQKEKKIKTYYKKLLKFKKSKKIDINEDESIVNTRLYLSCFEDYFKKNLLMLKTFDFKRHYKTKYNKSVFLGQKKDPPIKNKLKKKQMYTLAFSSPSLRSIQTTKIFSNKIKINHLLKEIDYGDVEGLNINHVKKQFPKLIKKWIKYQDPKFPNGESTYDVSLRVKKFLNLIKKLKNNDNTLIVTHNVFLRCLIGIFFDIPKYNWHKIKINYGETIKVKFLNSNFLIDIDRKKLKTFFKNLYENSSPNKTIVYT